MNKYLEKCCKITKYYRTTASEKLHKDCAVPSCIEEHKNKFIFPADESRGRLWLKAINSVHLNEIVKLHGYQKVYERRFKICAHHFQAELINLAYDGRRKLASCAIPKLCLDSNEEIPEISKNIKKTFYPTGEKQIFQNFDLPEY